MFDYYFMKEVYLTFCLRLYNIIMMLRGRAIRVYQNTSARRGYSGTLVLRSVFL